MNLLALLALVIIGPVDESAVDRVDRAIAAASASQRHLLVMADGGGGSVREGSLVIQRLRGVQCTAYVVDEAASMSAQIFVASGCHRVMKKDAKLWFHLPRVDVQNATFLDLQTVSVKLELVSRAICGGLEYGSGGTVTMKACIERLTALEPGTFWIVGAEEALALHLTDEVVE